MEHFIVEEKDTTGIKAEINYFYFCYERSFDRIEVMR